MSPIEAGTTDIGEKPGVVNLNGTNGVKFPVHVVSEYLLEALYSESVVAKVWKIANKALSSSKPPILYPEYTNENGMYVYRTLEFWTSGFFPGSMYLLLERLTRHPQIAHHSGKKRNIPISWPHPLQLEYLCRWWTKNLHTNALKRDTHDLGFMIAPWAMKSWTLHRDPAAYNSLVMAAQSLASRFNTTTQCLRSWDICITNRYSFTDPSQDFLVIIDNMLNLDLLFWVAHETSNKDLFDKALMHAHTTQKHHIRDDHSTFHVVNFDSGNGSVKAKFTNQGFSDSSCWARGQAWGILGFMQTFEWTNDPSFLVTAKELASYFITHLPDDGVPYWDLTAPIKEVSPRDTSAAMIAACGMLLLYKHLKHSADGEFYLFEAMKLVDRTFSKYLNLPKCRFERVPSASHVPVYPTGCIDVQNGDGFDGMTVVNESDSTVSESILHGATINNYEFAPRRWSNHGLVYADYYFLLFGNMLLDLGLIDTIGF
ncbi:uncharacterized protein N7469_009368 [Penicillium citrinum]|uniref:Uncharacterized protein n=1 Tax=Penicillium citrinum TaxID=5077 RepID=A0A9W9THQ9_PENCI|nr:uncharacterized protein N7469_009368 [Penicillium citrinum]KAJ5223128.1 hypothetical protein N7469_009368 [Penicillium citrinum]